MSDICLKVIVTGKVQNVGFRFDTMRHAIQLNLTGYAENLGNGSVEVLMCGQKDNVAQLAEWLMTGPESAKVDRSEERQVDWQVVKGFEIR